MEMNFPTPLAESGEDDGSSWMKIVARKRAERNTAITDTESMLKSTNGLEVKGVSTESSDDIIVDSELEELVSAIATGRISALKVTEIYVRRAILAHKMTNCLTEILFTQALSEAQQLDCFLSSTGRTVGPLHGIPVTVKDQFNITGSDTTLGYTVGAFKPASKSAWVVDTLMKAGAIIIAKTNLPQSIMWCETENPLWGLTTNPRNSSFTPGGSSGGEGVMLCLNASMIGFGTDIGGSIRIPSHMNGLWGLKPSSGRISYQGVPVSTEGQQHVPSSIGPMTRSVSALCRIMKVMIDAEPWTADPACPPLPWREEQFLEPQTRRLTFGVMIDDAVVRVHPPIERVLYETASILRQAGHELVLWSPSLHAECIAVMDQYYSADGGEDIRRCVNAGGEPFIPHVETLLSRGDAITVYQYWQLNKQKIALQQAYHDKWSSLRSPSGHVVDVLLTPTMPHTALPHRGCRWVGYTKVWNFLDYTALSFPAGTCVETKDATTPDYTPRNELDAWNWSRYDPESMHGHPIGLQLVGRRYEEEKTLGIAKYLDTLLCTRTGGKERFCDTLVTQEMWSQILPHT